MSAAAAGQVEPPRPSSPGGIRALLAAHGLRPSRALGQHFLADANTAARIVRLAEVHRGDRVLEVGPGVGSLTVALLDAGARVTAVELDRHLVPVLESVVRGHPVRIVIADARTADWPALLGSEDGWSVVANLPYNVGTSVLLGLLQRAPGVERMLVMLQREVAERVVATVGDEAYGAVSVKVALRAEATLVARVPPTVFVPRPRVDSALVRVVRRPLPRGADAGRVEELVDAGFATRRKTLRNALRARLGTAAPTVLATAGIDAGARAEEVPLSGWVALAAAEAGAVPDVSEDR